MLALATLTSTLTGPGQTIGVSVFIDHFVDDLDLSRSQVSRAYLIGTISGAALLPSIGRAIDRHGVRPAQFIIGVLFAGALVNMSLVNGFAWLAIGFVGIRFLGQGSLSLASTVTVSLAFDRNRGTAIGLFSTISGALMALVPLTLALVIALDRLEIDLARRGRRRDHDGADDRLVRPARPRQAGTNRPLRRRRRPRPPASHHYDRAQAMKTLPFWLLVAVSAAAGMLGTALNFHQIDLLGDAGLSATAAAALFLPQVVGSTVASIATGFVSDRVGTRYLPAAGVVALIAAHWLAAVVTPGVVVIVYAITLGAMGGGIRTAAATLLPAWFGTANLGSIQGFPDLLQLSEPQLWGRWRWPKPKPGWAATKTPFSLSAQSRSPSWPSPCFRGPIDDRHPFPSPPRRGEQTGPDPDPRAATGWPVRRTRIRDCTRRRRPTGMISRPPSAS